MGLGATISILGLYNYDDSIFDLLTIPAPDFDKDKAIQQILMDCAELEILYPDPAVMRSAIGLWSAGNQDAFDHVKKMIQAEYSPIENTDKYEEFTDVSTPNFQNVENGTDTQAATGFNSNTFKDTNRSSVSRLVSTTGNGSFQHTAHIHGNIGVTTNQQMLIAERDMVLSGYNFYQIVADMFKRKFCIRVY